MRLWHWHEIGSLFYQREDGGYWDLKENIHIFGHPTLETLTITRARLDEKGFESVEQPSETALTTLKLINCDINDDALSELLLFPDALKEITITHSANPEPPLEESANATMSDYILALGSANHSLESISIDFPTLGGTKALRMREFEQLHTLELRDYQLFGQSSSAARLHSVALPPNLETLKFWGPVGEDEEVCELLCYEIENMGFLARKLRRLEIEGGVVPEVVREFLFLREDGWVFLWARGSWMWLLDYFRLWELRPNYLDIKSFNGSKRTWGRTIHRVVAQRALFTRRSDGAVKQEFTYSDGSIL
jgi:hypothetical protein